MMRQLQFYKYATIVLLVLNVAMLAFFFITRPTPPPREDGRRKSATEWLNLDEQQHNTFLQLAGEHIQLMDDLKNQQKDLLKPYFASLTTETQAIATDTILLQIQEIERQKIESTYQHFQEIRAILKPEQMIDYKAFVNDAIAFILLGNDKKLKRSKDKR